MKPLTIFSICTILSISAFGQTYLTSDIRATADSILRIYIGDSIFQHHCVYDTNTYYEYKSRWGKTKWETLNKFRRTKGKFVKVDMRWFVGFPYPQCPVFKIGGMTSFVLDSHLKPTGKPYLDFVPDFYWQNDSCQLLNKEQALTIARRQKLKPGIGSLYSLIKYDIESKRFTWEVSQTLWIKKDTHENDYGDSEVVTIDAITGEIISHETIRFSAVY